MKSALHIPLSALVLIFGLQAAQADCYADYKAKKEQPLRLHYGVMELPDGACGNKRAAADEVARRIGRDGWKLLKVESLFDSGGLEGRKKSAGAYFLRY